MADIDIGNGLYKGGNTVVPEYVDYVVNRRTDEMEKELNDKLDRELGAHIDDTKNPHDVTKEQVGLGNADNTSDLEKPISAATQEALDDKVDKVSGKGLSANDYTTDEKNKLAGIEAGAQVNAVTSVAGKTGNVVLSKADVGLDEMAVSIGLEAFADEVGTAVGYQASAGRNSAAVGDNAFAYGGGGAMGQGARAGKGFAGGSQAQAVDADGGVIDAIQLGTGTNNTPKTLQIYDKQLLDAAGKIPAERLPDSLGETLADKANVAYCVCNTASPGAAGYAATVTAGTFELKTGAAVDVYFENACGAPISAKLDVGGTGAKPILYYGSTKPTKAWRAGEVARFIYDGTNWRMQKSAPATEETYGIVKISDAVNLTDSTTAASATAVRTTYNLASEANEVANYLVGLGLQNVSAPDTGQVQIGVSASAATDEDGSSVSIGKDAVSDTSGVAIGDNAAAAGAGGGVAIGKNASVDGPGAAVGVDAYANTGGAIGQGASAGMGFSGGSQAKCGFDHGAPVDCIQLGTGTNSAPKTLQIYDKQLLDANGKIPAERLSTSSDRRLKEGISNADSTRLLDFISRLQVVDYNYIGDETPRLGLIAQDIQAADEELSKHIVLENDAGYLEIRPEQMVFPLIAAVQELQKEIQAMKG